jgi:L-fucose isomerase-like protein
MDSVEYGMKMIKTARAMKESRIISIAGSSARDYVVPTIGTQVRCLPLKRYYDEIESTPVTDEVKELAQKWKKGAKQILEPTDEAIVTAARMHFLNKRVLEAEHGDAIMMDCLTREHFLPCMSYMHLRDHGTSAGCQNDLNATLTMMLLLHLFDKPGFMGNAGMDTINNLFHHAHCTSASKLNGVGTACEPYLLRGFAHTGLACVPEVLFREGQEVTLVHYLHGEKPQMLLYTGEVVKNCHMPPAGGCRTNITMTINELDDVCDVQGMHQTVVYGNHARQLKAFCQFYGIEPVT